MKIYRENACGCEKEQPQASGPCVMHWCAEALQNCNYRKAVWTGEYLQTTLMCIPACGDVGLEYHDDTDQLLLVAEGCCKVCMGKTKDNLCYQKTAKVGDAIYVPEKHWHNIVNTGKCPLKLFSVYAPPHHPANTLQRTKADAACE